MFRQGSRYYKQPTYSVTKPDGAQVTAVVPPLPPALLLRGFHRKKEGQRLDLIAARHLSDPTTFWRLCDANNSMVPDALAAQQLIGIPPKSET